MKYEKEFLKKDIKELIIGIFSIPIFIIIFIYIIYIPMLLLFEVPSYLSGMPSMMRDLSFILITSFDDFVITYTFIFGIFTPIITVSYTYCLITRRCFRCRTKIEEGDRILDKCTLCKQVDPLEIIQLRIRGWLLRKPAKIIIHDAITNESVTYKL